MKMLTFIDGPLLRLLSVTLHGLTERLASPRNCFYKCSLVGKTAKSPFLVDELVYASTLSCTLNLCLTLSGNLPVSA